MNKRFILILLLAISFNSYSKDITGKWEFSSILPDTIENGKNLKNISTGDVMEINNNGNFNYKIAKENLIANGTWEFTKNKLTLHYILPKEITRNYYITHNEKNLILNENGINYCFKKQTVNTTGITSKSIIRGLIGLISLLLITMIFSKDRKAIDWQLVFKGLGIQMAFAILILKVSFISS